MRREAAQLAHRRRQAEAEGRTPAVRRARWAHEPALSQADVCVMAGIGLSTLQGIEAGRSRGSDRTLSKIAAALGVDPAALRP